MTTSLKELKAIDEPTQFAVFGYIRQQEKELSLYINITPEIIYLCLAYYYLGEHFDKTAACYELSEDKMTVISHNESYSWSKTAYGKLWIDSKIEQIVTWKFKINKLVFKHGIYFCLVSRDDRTNEDCLDCMDHPNYGISDNFRVINNENDESKVNKKHALDTKILKDNDILSMILDTKKQELSCLNEDGEQLIVIENVTIGNAIRYKMAIQLFDALNSVSLIDFSLQHV